LVPVDLDVLDQALVLVRQVPGERVLCLVHVVVGVIDREVKIGGGGGGHGILFFF
jgi:hypothetical protein